MYVIAGVTEHVGSVAAKELLAKKGETWSKQGACYVMFPRVRASPRHKELAINRGE